MPPGKAKLASVPKDHRVNGRGEGDSHSGSVRKSADRKARGITMKASTPASDLKWRLEQAKQKAFNLLGGED